jgi:hypothetical protein
MVFGFLRLVGWAAYGSPPVIDGSLEVLKRPMAT